MNCISRFGAYGVLLRDSKILLSLKQSGPYQGLWDLPGGAIEFAETPEEALKRELLEEVALAVEPLGFLHTFTAVSECRNQDELYGFHQVGLIYKVSYWTIIPKLVPQEENRWVHLSEVALGELTPLAKSAISKLPKNKGWRPNKTIRGKAIGLAKHENKLLVCEVLNDEGMLKGWVPLGGGIEFGETAEQALKREFLEEVGATIQLIGSPTVFENIFEHQGVKGHEIVFAFLITLDQREVYAKNRFQISEHNGSTHWVEWVPIKRFEKKEAVLFPSAIFPFIR